MIQVNWSRRYAKNYVRDMSLNVLRTLKGRGIKSIEWHDGGHPHSRSGDDCSSLNGKTWGSLEEFVADRVFTGMDVGIYGHSHPGCNCDLVVTHPDGGETIINAEGTF